MGFPGPLGYKSVCLRPGLPLSLFPFFAPLFRLLFRGSLLSFFLFFAAGHHFPYFFNFGLFLRGYRVRVPECRPGRHCNKRHPRGRVGAGLCLPRPARPALDIIYRRPRQFPAWSCFRYQHNKDYFKFFFMFLPAFPGRLYRFLASLIVLLIIRMWPVYL